ncbi:hypothetical protein [Nocardia miyunensis]|uniref:hypothetical protein n=1 Tax=Nocardia miyunensis TaxID=282684 RepID=UPI00083312FC|nr:hypothetical protein [Nocardia miyunensis]
MSEGYSAPATVRVRVTAEHEQLMMLRALTDTALLTTELTLDGILDVQVAIDEVTTDLIEMAADGSMIECDLESGDGRIAVRISGIAVTRAAIDELGLGWHIIRTVTESPNADIGSYDHAAGGYPVTVEFGRTGPG